MEYLTIIGGGLAGCEAAWQAAQRGVKVILFEMRPGVMTGAHEGGNLAELVCSNSLGSNIPDRAPGLLKEELRMMGSLLIRCADETAIPAGGALAVDRVAFSKQVTEKILQHPLIELIRREVTSVPETTTVVASGPLTSPKLSEAIALKTGQDHLYFFDAIAPIVTLDSIDLQIAFRASRYERGVRQEGDYINCPFDRHEYEAFIESLLVAQRIELKGFELDVEHGVRTGIHRFFEACLPVEIMARRGQQALAFGPMRPVGLRDPRTGKRPYAVIQLRQDNLANTLYNMVGFQTNLKFSEQRRIFRMIPGMEAAEFVRYGQMHRNTFIFSPAFLHPSLQYKHQDNLFFAGQITGVEGYAGNIATGLLAGWNAARFIQGERPFVLPKSTLIGALCHYISHASPSDFQPMKANFGILSKLEDAPRSKRDRYQAYVQRSHTDLQTFLTNYKVEKTR